MTTDSSRSRTDYAQYHRARCRVVRCGGEVGFRLIYQAEVFDDLGVMKGIVNLDPFPATGYCSRCHQGHILSKNLELALEVPEVVYEDGA